MEQPEVDQARELAQRNGSCLTNMKLTFKANIFQGPLSAAAWAYEYREKPLPDYSTVPLQFTQAIVDLYDVKAWQDQVRGMAMAECVFRNNTPAVQRLFAVRPMTKNEDAVWMELQPLLGACLPVEEGVSLRFSKAGLRGNLGEAAYAVDRAFKTGKSLDPAVAM